MAEFGWAYVSGSNLPQGPNKSVQVKNNDEFTGSANFTYDTNTNDLILSGNMEISGSLYANEFVTNVTTKNVINLSATGSTSFGDTTDDTHTFTGSILLSSSTHPLHISGLQAGDRRDANSYLALDSSGRIILTASLTTTQTQGIASLGEEEEEEEEESGNIGDAEDGDYTDGLFTDFVTSTPVGTAVDRFNEVLKILAPSPAPSLKSMRADETNGATAKLSFDVVNAISDYSHVAQLSYLRDGGMIPSQIALPQILQNAVFQPTASSVITDAEANVFGNGSHVQLGIYNNQEITGTLNYDVGPNSTNGFLAFASGAFGNAETGSLNLIINDTTRHTSIFLQLLDPEIQRQDLPQV